MMRSLALSIAPALLAVTMAAAPAFATVEVASSYQQDLSSYKAVNTKANESTTGYNSANCHASFLRNCDSTGGGVASSTSLSTDAAPVPALAATLPGAAMFLMGTGWVALRQRKTRPAHPAA